LSLRKTAKKAHSSSLNCLGLRQFSFHHFFFHAVLRGRKQK